jgi:hypothetical protein
MQRFRLMNVYACGVLVLVAVVIECLASFRPGQADGTSSHGDEMQTQVDANHDREGTAAR